MSETKSSINFKDLHDRIVAFFDDKGMLKYERIDVQTIPKKQYFLAVCISNPSKDPSGSPYVRSDKFSPAFYFSTQNLREGVASKDEVYEKWINVFIDQNHKNVAEFREMYPSTLRSLDATKVSELVLKMGVLGV